MQCRHDHIIAILFSCYSSLVLAVVTLIVAHAFSHLEPTSTGTQSCVSYSPSVSVTRQLAAR